VLIGRGFASFLSGFLRHGLAAQAPQASTRPLRLAIISEGVNTWPLYVAQEKKMFRSEGVEVEVTLTGSSVKQLEQLRAGDYDMGFQQSDHVVRAVEQGSDLFIFMALAHAPELSLIVAPEVRSFDDLRGNLIAVDGARTGYALLLRKLLADKGLREADYTFREIGGSQERHDALKNGIAQASLLNPPFERNLVAAGFGSLGTTGEYFPTYPGSIAAARRGWAKQHERQLIAFIRGFNRAYGWLQDPANRDEAIKLLPDRLNIKGEVASRAFARFVQRPRPSVMPDSLRQVIDIVWAAEGFEGRPGAPEKYLDLGYLHTAMQQ
jgi:ABC-type nitrate/sulfonate/bicarbonate transport system substrate-binding protein